MAFEQTRLDRPLSRIELVIAVSIIMILIAMAINRMQILAVEAERLAVELTIRSLKSSTRLYSAGKIIENKLSDIAMMEGANPIGTLLETPGEYIGEISGYEKQLVEPGQWYYDKAQKHFVYRVVNDDYFSNVLGTDEIHLRLKLEYADVDKDGHYNGETDLVSSLNVAVVYSYEWLL